MTDSGGDSAGLRPATLSVEELTVGFNGHPIVERFSLSLAEGEKVTETGPSGSGKSTLLRCVIGFIPPYGGSIRVKGERVSETTVWWLRCLMAYVPQEPEMGTGSVRSILEEPFSYGANTGLRSNLERIPDLFQCLLLPLGLLDQELSKVSGGEKQRIAIVSALLLQREILLLDEATSALDKRARAALVEYLTAQTNLTILSVAHDPGDLRLAGKVVALKTTTGQQDNVTARQHDTRT
jgi:putative ABC transport system ATP-binding protein